MNSIKRFLRNKNTVTLICIAAIILIIYFGYSLEIKDAVQGVNVYVANGKIQPRTEITDKMIKTIKVAKVGVPKNVVRNKNNIIGKYTNVNTVIPDGSMFYSDVLVDEKNLPDSAYVDIPVGQVPYNFPVTMSSTYGNSILPGSYIDIYMKAYNEQGRLMVGKLLENVKVLAVRDASGRNVFENTDETRTPAFFIFGLDYENNIMLRKASYMSSYSVTLFPVPHGAEATSELTENVVSSQTLKDFINANTVANDELINNQINFDIPTIDQTVTG